MKTGYKRITCALMPILCFALVSDGFAQALQSNITGHTASKQKDSSKQIDTLPEDYGPDRIFAMTYPANIQKGYDLLMKNCTNRVDRARLLNAPYVEVKSEELVKIKAEQPEVLKDRKIWQIELSEPGKPGIWQRRAQQMQRESAGKIRNEDARLIWQFLVYDSKSRKLGSAAKPWRERRQKLLDEFKTKHPAKYEELFYAK